MVLFIQCWQCFRPIFIHVLKLIFHVKNLISYYYLNNDSFSSDEQYAISFYKLTFNFSQILNDVLQKAVVL